MTARSWWFSISSFRMLWCALLEPNKNAVRHDAGAASAGFEHPQEERKEKQFRLFGVGDGLQVVVDALCVHGALERRVRKADRVLAANGVLLGNAVFVVDLRVRDGVEHQVHGRNAQHGAVRVKAGEHRAGKMLPLLRGHAVLVVGAEVLRTGHQKARRAAGGVADKVVRRGLHQLHHHVADVFGRAELAVLPAVASLPSIYSYRSPCISRSAMSWV